MIFDKLVEIMIEKLGVEPQEINLDTSFKEDLAVDSLDMYDLITALEDEFNIELPEERTADIYAVGDLIRLLKEQE